MSQNESWYNEQRKKSADRLQNAIEEEFEKTHEVIIKYATLKDKGTIRNINNYRMKLWCDMFISYKKESHERSAAASYATKDLEMFDLQFNK